MQKKLISGIAITLSFTFNNEVCAERLKKCKKDLKKAEKFIRKRDLTKAAYLFRSVLEKSNDYPTIYLSKYHLALCEYYSEI